MAPETRSSDTRCRLDFRSTMDGSRHFCFPYSQLQLTLWFLLAVMAMSRSHTHFECHVPASHDPDLTELYPSLQFGDTHRRKHSLLTPIFSHLGYLEFAMAAPSRSDSTYIAASFSTGPSTIFAPGRCITVKTDSISGIQSSVSPFTPFSCDVEKTSSPSYPYHSYHRSGDQHTLSGSMQLAIVNLMIQDAFLRLHNNGFSTLALTTKVRYSKLTTFNNRMIFAVEDPSIFSGSRSYTNSVRFHMVLNHYLTFTDLERLPVGTTLPIGTTLPVTMKKDVANHKTRAMQINIGDLINYNDLDEIFFGRVTENAPRYIGFFAEAIAGLMPEPTKAFTRFSCSSESPRWLVTKGRLGDARIILQRIRGTRDVSGELALLVEDLSPTGDATSLEEYTVAPASEVTAPVEAFQDYIKPYEPNQGALGMVAALVTVLAGSSRILSRQASISQVPGNITDLIVNLFGSIHGDNPADITAIQGSSLSLIEPTAGTSDYFQFDSPLLSSSHGSVSERYQAVVNKDTDIGGGWQLMYKEAVHHQYPRVYLHAEGGAAIGVSQSQRASALVSMSALGTNKVVAKAMNDINYVQPNAWTPDVRHALIVGNGLQDLQQAAGINGLLHYGPQVLEKAGVGALLAELGFTATSSSLLVNVVITFCMLPCVALSMTLMDIAGRRSIMLYTFHISRSTPPTRSILEDKDLL